MANISGPQNDVKYCPACKADLSNVPRDKMKTRVTNRGGDVPRFTHTYICSRCKKKFEINQDR
jgi:uncharacterized protein with PIN domain